MVPQPIKTKAEAFLRQADPVVKSIILCSENHSNVHDDDSLRLLSDPGPHVPLSKIPKYTNYKYTNI